MCTGGSLNTTGCVCQCPHPITTTCGPNGLRSDNTVSVGSRFEFSGPISQILWGMALKRKYDIGKKSP